jgi:hypothetical protein
MYKLGWYMRQATVRDKEPDARRGQKVSQGARKGHEARYGTGAEKNEEHQRYQQQVDSLRRRKPLLSKTSISRLVANKFEVSPRTIRRYTRW